MMKPLAFFAFIVSLSLLFASCERQETDMSTSEPALYVHFASNGESYYTDISIENGQLRYTYFHDENNRCAQWFRSEPCWSQAGLKTVQTQLSQQQQQQLTEIIKQSGILQSPHDASGDTRAGQRVYTEKLAIRLARQTRQLRYHSSPSAPPKPEAFARIENTLRQYAQQIPKTTP